MQVSSGLFPEECNAGVCEYFQGKKMLYDVTRYQLSLVNSFFYFRKLKIKHFYDFTSEGSNYLMFNDLTDAALLWL